jgi:hypothetical protein
MALIKIPGGTATLRDKLVAERHFRILEAAYISAGPALQKLQQDTPTEETGQSEEERVANMLSKGEHLTMSESMSLLELQDAAIIAFLERWSLSQPLPTLDTVGDIDRETYKVLSEATKGLVVSALGIGTPSFEPTPVQVDAGTGELFPTGESSTLDGP